jgi:hypothetical protein
MIIKYKAITQTSQIYHSLTVSSGTPPPKKIGFFRYSLYEIAVIDAACPYPHTRISSENPIQYFAPL